MTAKNFYRSYQSDSVVSPLAERMMTLINQDRCVHAFEFGCGEGKHLRRLESKGVVSMGMDLSILNCIRAQSQGLGIMYGDEKYLRHFCNADAVFTVSCLDHIEDIDGIIQELKRIANKVVYLIETNDVPGEFYYPHEYKKYGFDIVGDSWVSEKPDGDGATYYLLKWSKGQNESIHLNDDLCVGIQV